MEGVRGRSLCVGPGKRACEVVGSACVRRAIGRGSRALAHGPGLFLRRRAGGQEEGTCLRSGGVLEACFKGAGVWRVGKGSRQEPTKGAPGLRWALPSGGRAKRSGCQEWDSNPRLQGRLRPERSALDRSAILTALLYALLSTHFCLYLNPIRSPSTCPLSPHPCPPPCFSFSQDMGITGLKGKPPLHELPRTSIQS